MKIWQCCKFSFHGRSLLELCVFVVLQPGTLKAFFKPTLGIFTAADRGIPLQPLELLNPFHNRELITTGQTLASN